MKLFYNHCYLQLIIMIGYTMFDKNIHELNVGNILEQKIAFSKHPTRHLNSDYKRRKFGIVEILGEVETYKSPFDSSYVTYTNKVKIIRVITYYDILNLCTGMFEENGTCQYFRNGVLHRDDDLPAVICENGGKEWWKNGLRHRDTDNPALISVYGTQGWFKNGMQHRDNDLPAIIQSNGTRTWCKNGIICRDNDLPSIIRWDGSEEWHINGKLGRDNDLPARICADGTLEWYVNDNLHRNNNLPARIRTNGIEEWYTDGKLVKIEHVVNYVLK